nr:MAG TPA: DNA-directed RNA polymerase [Caudoviricetes sp.]
MTASETLICPHCRKVQYTHEPDKISAYCCITECEHCGKSFWYSVEVSYRYGVLDYDQIGREDNA